MRLLNKLSSFVKLLPVHRALIWLLLLTTIFSVLASSFEEFTQQRSFLLMGPSGDPRNYDPIDVPGLLQRASQCKTFAQTTIYWHEWFTTGRPYYRPLSLTCFWMEYHLFGVHHFELWDAVSVCVNIAFCVLFGFFVRNLTGSTPASLLSVILFSGIRSIWPIGQTLRYLNLDTVAPAYVAVSAWKDQPDLFSDCAIIIALICVQRERWISGLTAATIAVLFKESGWITYGLAPCLIAASGRMRQVPKWAYPIAILFVAIPIVARSLAGMGMIGGEHIGSNQYWPTRYFVGVCGYCLNGALHGMWPAALLGATLYAVVRWKASFLIRIAAAAASTISAAFLNSKVLQAPMVIGAEVLLDPSLQLKFVIFCFIFCVGLGCVAAEKTMTKHALVLYTLSLVAALPYVAAAQVTVHALYLCYAFQTSAVGIAWLSAYRTALRRMDNPQLTAAGVKNAAAV